MIWIIISISVLLVLLIGLLTYYFVKKRSNKLSTSKANEEYTSLLDGLGGKDNITSVLKKGTRISIEIKDKNKVDKDQIKSAGISTIVATTSKITIAIDNGSSESIYDYLSNINKENE